MDGFFSSPIFPPHLSRTPVGTQVGVPPIGIVKFFSRCMTWGRFLATKLGGYTSW